MQSVSVFSATAAHAIPPAAYRVAVLGRRIKASPSVAALLADLAFGSADRDRATATPMLCTASH